MSCTTGNHEYDSEFVFRLRQRETAAFKTLFDETADLVYRRAFAYLGNETMAEDATQEIFYKVWQALPSLESGKVRPWLMAIARNYCCDELRKKKRRSEILRDVECYASNIQLSMDGSEDEIEMLCCLPEEIRLPLLLKVVDGMSYKEISQIVNKAEGTLRNLVCKGMKILKKGFDENEL